MIHYNVRCSHAHEFDGWFKDSAAFDRLTRRGMVECPTCGDTKVERALMAPAVATREALPMRLPALNPPVPQVAENSPSAAMVPSAPMAPSAAMVQSAAKAMTGGAIPDQMR